MDQELKQRLIGAAVVTALAAIFIPMLFDDPVDTSGQAVSEMTIPEPPANSPNGPETKLPADAASVENGGGHPPASEAPAATANPADPATSGTIEKIEPGLQENAPDDYQPPADVETNADADASDGQTADTAEPAPAAKPQALAEPAQPKPLAASPSVKPPAPRPAAPAYAPSARIAEPETATRPAPVRPVEPQAAKPSAKFERWSIQAGSFSKKENALTQRDKLRKLGFPATLETIATDNGSIYRLKIGPELSKQRATEIRNRLHQQNIKSMIVAE